MFHCCLTTWDHPEEGGAWQAVSTLPWCWTLAIVPSCLLGQWCPVKGCVAEMRCRRKFELLSRVC